MTHARLCRALFACLLVAFATGPLRASAQATCVDTTGLACQNLLSAADPEGVVNDIFETSDGRFAPQLNYATLVRGVNGCVGWTGWDASETVYQPNRRTFLEGYYCHAPVAGEDLNRYADSLDWLWTQVLRTNDAGVTLDDGTPGFYVPWRGRIYDLGGEANRVALFPITDHVPLPCEAFEYTVWLSNNPDATEIADPNAPDPNLWNEARLIRAYTEGWTQNPNATGTAEAGRADLATHLRDASSGDAVADALTTLWALPCGITFRYAAIQAGNNGNPGPECAFHSTDDELDAVAGLNEDDTAICVDADGDGHRDAACGGSDCDDSDPAVHPGAFEPCDATQDFDCLPAAECPEGTICDEGSGLCVTRCFEGGCGAGFECRSGQCIEAACAALEEPCPAGTLCREGLCVGPCEGVVCPDGERCQGGACIDPCLGVVCPSNQVCLARDPSATTLCGPACTCDEISTPLCPSTAACEARPESPDVGLCVDPGCETAICGEGESCRGGACVDGCEGVVCPRDQVCRLGVCEIDECARVTCPGSQVCRSGACFDACDGVECRAGQLCRDGACIADPCFNVECRDDERCVNGSCVPTGPRDGGPRPMDSGPAPDAGPTGVMDGGCGCRAISGGASPTSLAWLALLGALVWRRQRR